MVFKIGDLLLTPEKAIVVKKTAIISDLHLGIENVLLDRGIHIPRMQVDEIIKNTKEIIEKYSINRLVIAGDLKHEFSRNLPYEWDDVKRFLDEIDVEIEVVRGNHDNYLGVILSKYDILLVDELSIENWRIVHGHRNCDSNKILMGHEHPAIKIRFEGGFYTFPCYLKISDERRVVVVMPAFSPILPGSNILNLDSFLSPILKNVKLGEVEVYGIADDVFYLGRVSNLMV
ncbi:phosphoesterase [Archaeoglobales archaeon]|nr:MAG: phosphoesterase [Archaeoglobales archaeon]